MKFTRSKSFLDYFHCKDGASCGERGDKAFFSSYTIFYPILFNNLSEGKSCYKQGINRLCNRCQTVEVKLVIHK